jgi:hypothetical protein
MILSLLVAAGVFVGGVLLGLLGWGLWVFWSRKRRRSLAFALVGEIAGILRLIETDRLEFCLRENAKKRQSKVAGSGPFIYAIPRPTIFEANAKELKLLHPQLNRKVAQFHALLGGISGNMASTVRNTERAKATLVQLEEALLLGDDILHSLKPLL